MRKIRKGVFETNSSSSHSICIDDKTFILDTLIPDADGVITIKAGQFGWEWKKYNDAKAKASYCLTGTLYVEDRQIALDSKGLIPTLYKNNRYTPPLTLLGLN